LFHALVFPAVAALNIKYLPFAGSFAAPVVTTVISAIIIYPIALLSYRFFEKPFLSVGNLTTK
jgi:peptidoglycan/LPS O-acetylase OafA/YrhL